MFYLELKPFWLRHFGDEGEVPSVWAPCLITYWATCYVDLVTLIVDFEELDDINI